MNHDHQRGKKQYKEARNAYRKLLKVLGKAKEVEIFAQSVVVEQQTEKRKEQKVSRAKLYQYLKEFKEKTPCNAAIVNTFCLQIIYGLRFSEVFAIANLECLHSEDDTYTFFALVDSLPKMKPVYIASTFYIKGLGELTTKTGARISLPWVDDELPFNELITPIAGCIPLMPLREDRQYKSENILPTHGERWLKRLSKGEYSQTHALRHLANHYARSKGISVAVRAESLGHSEEMNHAYNKHLSIADKIKLLQPN